MNELNINNEPLKTSTQEITIRNQVLNRNNPPSINIDPASPIKSADPKMIVQTFGIQFLQTEIYKGRIAINTPDPSPIARKSKLGTSIFSDLQFVERDGEVHVPVDTVLFDVMLGINVVRTPIQGKDGQVKEHMGEDDADLTIRGVICGDNGVYPIDDVKSLLSFARTKQSLGIISKYLNEVWDIHEIVIYKILFEQPEGSQSYQKFELQAWSDKPVEILIKEAK